jgi:heme exporter protein C
MMRASTSLRADWRHLVVAAVILCLLLGAMLMIFGYAPTEATMGEVQRILYLHVSVAWCGLAGCLGMSACGAIYLVRRSLAWDHWSQAAAEIGWLCTTLTLVTGSLWARQAWGVWWTWDPRLSFSLVLWLVFAAIILVRASLDEPHRRARMSAVLAILAACDIPMIVMATRWFRGMHPVAPEMDPRMRLVLLSTAMSLTAFAGFLIGQRARQLGVAERAAAALETTSNNRGNTKEDEAMLVDDQDR